MLQVLYTPRTREVRVEASTDVFAALAAAARAGGGELACSSPVTASTVGPGAEGAGQDGPDLDLRDPDLDAELALSVVVIQAAADPLVTVSLRVTSPGLVIRGGIERLELLARDFDQLSKAETGEHLAAEWFPGHAYLVANSVPTTFAVAAAGD